MVIDGGSTAFMLVCMALVQFMTPGLAFFYGGLVSDKSVITMMMQSFVSMGITSIFWFVCGFSLCFGESGSFIGSPWTYFGFRNLNVNEAWDGTAIPSSLFAMYQGMFAVITPALMTGAFADRFRFKPYLLFIILWLVLVYAPFCHWVWGGGWLAEWGVWDFAGGIVVHITAGFSALASLAVVGKRPLDPTVDDKDVDKPHNVPFVALGTAMLWFGWFGFNGGSALASGGPAVAAAVNSEIAGSVALFLWLVIDWLRNGRPGLVGLCVGAIAGLATVTPAAGFIQPWGAFIIGIVATTFCYCCCELRKKFGLDDALDVWGVHGMGGFFGTILLGVLADGDECATTSAPPVWCVNPGTVTRSWEQLGKQIVAALFTAAYSFVVTFVLLKVINVAIPIKPMEDDVLKGLDAKEHGEDAYHTPPKTYAAGGNGSSKEKPENVDCI
jgi:Amt family ammonium transporter